MDKYEFVRNAVKRINAKENVTREEINTALSYFRELTETKQFPGSELEARQFGATISTALHETNEK